MIVGEWENGVMNGKAAVFDGKKKIKAFFIYNISNYLGVGVVLWIIDIIY